ncbi:MAG: methyltransferase domain-containing protein [Chloroflexi bacterium]|nr:methyltransferase domain-containing protein [Chloroflexota bacterium]
MSCFRVAHAIRERSLPLILPAAVAALGLAQTARWALQAVPVACHARENEAHTPPPLTDRPGPRSGPAASHPLSPDGPSGSEMPTTGRGLRECRRLIDDVNRSWASWPGSIVRAPRLTEPHYLQHRRLLLTLVLAIERFLTTAQGLTIVDIGAGKKPYFPFWASRARHYVGVDLPGTPYSQVYAASERLPLRSESLDVVVSTQMLEHADDPAAVLRECHRALRPGGLIFASTHGASYYHPIPVDHWRWTHTGLRKLFEQAGFRVRSIEGTTGTLTTLTTLLASYYLGAAHRLGCERLASRALAPVNLAVRFLDGVDRRPPTDEAQLQWGAMPWTYLVVAERTA